MPAIDVFVDLSRLEGSAPQAVTAQFEGHEALGAIAQRIFVAAPRSFATSIGTERETVSRILTVPAVQACNVAIEAAAAAGRPLLVLLGSLAPSSEAIGILLEALDDDPMIGFAVARLTGSQDDSLAVLDWGGDQAIEELPRRLLAEIPDTYLVADSPGRCLLIAPGVLGNFGRLDERFRSAAGALWHYVGRARRCGFRTVVCNRAIVLARQADARISPCVVTRESLPPSDRALLRDVLSDAERAREEFGTRTIAPNETRVARALPKAFAARPSLLLDVRNIGREINGTATAALGIAGGLRALAPEWEVALLARREASAIHRLEDLFPAWPVHTSLPDRQFTATLRLSQPWHVQEMIELHGLAAYNLYLFLDTISWDVAYPAPRHLDATWRFMADHADGVVFISEFSRARFRRRFESLAAVPTLVSHLSFDAADYVRADVRQSAEPDGPLFVIGNAYDHKDVSETSDLLAGAFPYQSIVALGSGPAPTPRVTVLESGALSEIELHRLYAGARLVVFPSFYEGFGFPIVTSLSYRRTLLARRSALLEEIVARCGPGGRVVPYDRRDDLVELVGRVLHGDDVPDLPLGTALGHRRPKSWRDIARDILGFVAEVTADFSRSRWRSRDLVIGQLMAARGELVAR